VKEDKPKSESKPALLLSCAVSALLLVLLLWLQATHPDVMELKGQWLLIAVLPILIGLIIGKYIGKVKGHGWDIELGTQIGLTIAPGQTPPESSGNSLSEKEPPPPLSGTPWTLERDNEYRRTERLFLVHAYEPSATPGQKYDITVFLVRNTGLPNQRDGFSEVKTLELYFGPTWNDAIFTSANNGGLLGVRTSAWAPFLATGRLTFNDSRTPPLILQRYIDFEMAQNKK
jgi:hypothetical protein